LLSSSRIMFYGFSSLFSYKFDFDSKLFLASLRFCFLSAKDFHGEVDNKS